MWEEGKVWGQGFRAIRHPWHCVRVAATVCFVLRWCIAIIMIFYTCVHTYTHMWPVPACVCGGWVSVCACVPVFVFVYNFPHINMHMGALCVSPYQLAYPFIATARCVRVCEYNYVCVCACGVHWYYFIYFFSHFHNVFIAFLCLGF